MEARGRLALLLLAFVAAGCGSHVGVTGAGSSPLPNIVRDPDNPYWGGSTIVTAIEDPCAGTLRGPC